MSAVLIPFEAIKAIEADGRRGAEVAPVRVMVTFISSANKRSRCATPASPAAARA